MGVNFLKQQFILVCHAIKLMLIFQIINTNLIISCFRHWRFDQMIHCCLLQTCLSVGIYHDFPDNSKRENWWGLGSIYSGWSIVAGNHPFPSLHSIHNNAGWVWGSSSNDLADVHLPNPGQLAPVFLYSLLRGRVWDDLWWAIYQSLYVNFYVENFRVFCVDLLPKAGGS